MRTIKTMMVSAGAVLLLAGCDVKDPIYNTPHPEHGEITLTTDWTNIGAGITAPASYTAKIGDFSATLSGATNLLDHLFAPGDYTIYAHNTADKITVTGTTATADYSGVLGWLFTGKEAVAIEKDTDHAFTVPVAQQVRELTLIIEPTGGTIDRVTTITGTLSGVAGTLDFETGTHGSPTSVALNFTKIASGPDAGKWTATVRLLGVTGAEQKLTGTITFTGGTPGNLPLESVLTTDLAAFNADKKTPLTLGGTVVETPTETGFTATITDWTKITGSGIAD